MTTKYRMKSDGTYEVPKGVCRWCGGTGRFMGLSSNDAMRCSHCKGTGEA